MTDWIDIGATYAEEVAAARRAGLENACHGCMSPSFARATAEIFAASNNACPHKQGPLSEGIVHGQSVTCPLHNWVFDLNTGEAQGSDDGRIDVYPVRLEHGRILIDGDAIGQRSAA